MLERESERFGSKRKEKQRSKPRLFEEFDQKC